MKKSIILLFICLFSMSVAAASNHVVLLHGLARSANSFAKMEIQLVHHGYKTCNISYPSTKYTIETLTAEFVMPEINKCFGNEDMSNIHFVTHSMGGIIARMIAKQNPTFPFGRVVMLSPPNHGSEVVDELGHWWLFQKINGPAGAELGTDLHSIPNQLGPAPFELGIITGDKSINFMLSGLIPGKDDGKVSLESAKLTGMKDFLVIPATHTFIMKNDLAIEQTLQFLEFGQFK